MMLNGNAYSWKRKMHEYVSIYGTLHGRNCTLCEWLYKHARIISDSKSWVSVTQGRERCYEILTLTRLCFHLVANKPGCWLMVVCRSNKRYCLWCERNGCWRSRSVLRMQAAIKCWLLRVSSYHFKPLCSHNMTIGHLNRQAKHVKKY